MEQESRKEKHTLRCGRAIVNVLLPLSEKKPLKPETHNVDFYCETRTKQLKPTDC